MPESTVTLTWNEPVAHFGINEQMVKAALERGVREYLIEDQEFRSLIRQAIRQASANVTVEAITDALRDDLFGILKKKITDQSKELHQCLADYKAWQVQHASEYATRRFKELSEKMDSLDRS